MAQFTIYTSSDPSAPVMTGTSGSLVALLDAVLVNGYGSKPAAGWTKAFSGVDRAAYRQGSGSQFYLRVRDDGPGTSTFQEARVVGYESMTDVDTGTGLFGGAITTTFMVARKSATANATARNWICYADSRTLYLFILTGDGVDVYCCLAFGDFYTLSPTDKWNCMIIARATEGSATLTLENISRTSSVSATTTLTGHYAARSFGGGAGEIQFGKHGDTAKSGSTSNFNGSSNTMPQPNPVDNSYYLSPIWVTESSGAIRGYMRGMWQMPCNAASLTDGQLINGANDLNGKSFKCVKDIRGGTTTPCVAFIETSNTLATN